jgi:hypothetical protein
MEGSRSQQGTAMRKIGKILLIAFILILANISIAADGPTGFGGLTWGTKFSTVREEFVHSRTNPSLGGIEYYMRKNGEMTIAEAKLDRIEYGFWQDKFCAVKFYFSGNTNFSLLKRALFKRFGPGTQPNDFIEAYFWFSIAEALINIGYDEVSEKGGITMVSKEFTEKAKRYKIEKDKEGPKKDLE